MQTYEPMGAVLCQTTAITKEKNQDSTCSVAEALPYLPFWIRAGQEWMVSGSISSLVDPVSAGQNIFT